MLSRRSVRIKVMQLLFSLSRDQDLSPKDAEKAYWLSVDNAFQLYLYNLHIISLITKEAIADEAKRKAKHLPTDLDKVFTAKIYTNELVQDVINNKDLQNEFKKLGFDQKLNEDYFKKIYSEFAKSEEYQAYVSKETAKADHLEILLELYRFCRKDEFYNELMEDNFMNWQDDKSVVIGTLKKSLKLLPTPDRKFFKAYYPDDETVKEFGAVLFKKTSKQDKELAELIIPTLKNWDHDRVAVIDMILLKMAIIEFETFESIPTKVTINEYVEISKLYSTPKSKDFINGILDRIKKEMQESGRIAKSGRGLIE